MQLGRSTMLPYSSMWVSAPRTSTSALPVLALAQRYYGTVLAWGRNIEGQCASGDEPVVLKPTAVAVASSEEGSIRSVHAGKQSSCFVAGLGTAWTWGCGKAGKLGHGSSDPMASPAQVEALVGRANVKKVAMGELHSLFLDDSGSVWGCGEDKEGQCGLGTPQEVLARQQHLSWKSQRAALQQVAAPTPHASVFSSTTSSLSRSLPLVPPAPPLGPSSTLLSPRLSSCPTPASPGLLPAAPLPLNPPTWTLLNGTAIDMERHLALRGLEPGQHPTPLRLGPGFSNLFAPANSDETQPVRGFGSEEVVSLAVSKYFSALATSSGEVWTFGACFNGGLGAPRSRSSRPTPLQDALAEQVQAAGGAVKVAVGSRFGMALLRNGCVLLWGKLSHAASGGTSTVVASSSPRGLLQQPPQFCFVQGLPAIVDIAAGQQHAVLTDGKRVWSIGRRVDATGVEVGSSNCNKPVEVLHLRGERVAKLVAGPSSSAVVTDKGTVWLWGKLLDRHHAEGLTRQIGRDLITENVDWLWPGFGGRAPARVPHLEGIKDLALGGWHALALQEE